MGISGGGDRSELRPLKQDGNVDHDLPDIVVGNHKGQYGYFNIINPKPGTVHQWTTDDEFLGCMQRGWWPAGPDDGSPANALMQMYSSETGNPFPGYRHVVTSEANYRKLQEERQAENRRQLSEDAAFLEGVSGQEHSLFRGSGRGRPSRFATQDHGTIVRENQNTIEHLGATGIIREDI